MATKPYPPIEETPSVVHEPAVAYQAGIRASKMYQVTDAECENFMRKEQCAREEICSESEMDKMAAEWLRPHTMEEINAICDEAEADDEADRLLSSSYVYAEMERLNPWLCK